MGVDGLGTKVNDEGITFYNNIINALLERGIVCIKLLYLAFLGLLLTIDIKLLLSSRYSTFCNFVPLGSSVAS